MSQWIHSACPKCGSSDALSYKEGDEWAYCFSCNRNSPVDPNAVQVPKENYDMHTLEEIESYDTRGFQERDIEKTITRHFGVKVSYSEDGTINSHFYPYTKDGEIVAYKERKLPKTFSIHGDFKGVQLFGQNVAGGGKRVIITEGELDCMAVAQAQYDKYSKFYPVVALPSASNTRMLLEQREWLRTFDEVILMLDSDEPGQKATQEAAKIIGFDKVKVAHLPEKDPCDVMVKHGREALMKCVWDAKPYNPQGILSGQQIWEEFKLKQSIVSLPYPPCLDSLNGLVKGIRLGEIVLFTSGTGSGKSTVIKEIVLEILAKTEDKVGMISLEESIGDTAEKFIGMQLKKNLAGEEVSEDEKYAAFLSVFGDERLVLLDHQGSFTDENLIDKMEYLALSGCKYIILDHVSLAVSEGVKGKTGNEAMDGMMSDLLKLCKKHNVWLGVISHLRKSDNKPFEEGHMPSIDDLRGSSSLKQIAFDIIAFCRNMVAETEVVRNTIKLRVLKSRFSGKTGDCAGVQYDPLTGRLKQLTITDFD